MVRSVELGLVLVAVAAAGCFSGRGTDVDGGGGDDARVRDGGLFYEAFPARRRLEIGTGFVLARLEGFPLMVRLDDAPDPDGLAFFDESGTSLAHELEPTSEDGALVAWVRVPVLEAATPTSIYLAFDGPPDDRARAASVWEEYAGVWHLGAAPGASVTLDSTASASHASTIGTVAFEEGVIGRAAGLTRAGVLVVGDPLDGHLDYVVGGWTFSLWARWMAPRPPEFGTLLHKGGSTSDSPGYTLEVSDSDDRVAACAATASGAPVCPGADFGSGSWHHVAGVIGDGLIRLYVDGGLAEEVPYDGDASTTLPLSFGGQVGGAALFAGWLDEVQIAPTARSLAWIRAIVDSQRPGSSFVSIGDVERAD